MSQTGQERVLNNIEITESCWNWTGAIGTHGYGVLSFKGKYHTAHRLSYTLFKEDPKEKFVCHSCDNKKCVNPNHLFLGTNQDNIDDAKSKGIKLGRSKAIAEEQIKLIHSLKDDGCSGREISRKTGMSVTTVARVLRNEY